MRWLSNLILGGLFLFFFTPLLHSKDNSTIYFKREVNGVPFFTDAPTTPDFVQYLTSGASRSGERLNLKNIDTFDEIIVRESEKVGIDPYLIKALIMVESGFNPRAVSPRGARGLMQIMPGLGKALDLHAPFDPEENIRCGVKHFKHLLDLFNNDASLALAAYNAGEKSVLNYGGIPPYEETIEYVQKVNMVANSLMERGWIRREEEVGRSKGHEE